MRDVLIGEKNKLDLVCGPGYECQGSSVPGFDVKADGTTHRLRCLRAPLPTNPACFREQQIYSVLGGEAFVVSSPGAGFLHTDVPGPDGVCVSGDGTGVNHYASGRIPLVFEPVVSNPATQLGLYSKVPDCGPAIGPAWRDVSNKYAGQRGAEDSLTLTVLGGSNPYASHWKGKVSGLAMPPNQVAISEPDARQLVKWILALGPGK